MTQALQDQELLAARRATWIDALMKEGYRQCTGEYQGDLRVKFPLPVLDLHNGDALVGLETYREVCALGLADEVIGAHSFLFGPDQDYGPAAGRIAHDNDRHLFSFAQIADHALRGRYW